MSYGHSGNTGLKVIHSYAQARQRLEGTKSIRGRADDQIPLGNRDRIDQFRINLDPHTLDVLLICYDTPVVRWHPDDTITIKTDNWNTQTTAFFIGAVTGLHACRSMGYMCVSVQSGQYTVPRTGVKLSREPRVTGGHEYLSWEPVNPEQHTVHKLNRKASRQAGAFYRAVSAGWIG